MPENRSDPKDTNPIDKVQKKQANSSEGSTSYEIKGNVSVLGQSDPIRVIAGGGFAPGLVKQAKSGQGEETLHEVRPT